MWRDWKVLSVSGKTNIDYMPWAFTQTSELRCQVTCSIILCVQFMKVLGSSIISVFLSRISDSLFDHEDWIVVFQWKSSAWSCFPILLKMRTNSLWRKARLYKLSGRNWNTGFSFYYPIVCVFSPKKSSPSNFPFQSRSWRQGMVERRDRWQVGCSDKPSITINNNQYQYNYQSIST